MRDYIEKLSICFKPMLEELLHKSKELEKKLTLENKREHGESISYFLRNHWGRMTNVPFDYSVSSYGHFVLFDRRLDNTYEQNLNIKSVMVRYNVDSNDTKNNFFDVIEIKLSKYLPEKDLHVNYDIGPEKLYISITKPNHSFFVQLNSMESNNIKQSTIGHTNKLNKKALIETLKIPFCKEIIDFANDIKVLYDIDIDRVNEFFMHNKVYTEDEIGTYLLSNDVDVASSVNKFSEYRIDIDSLIVQITQRNKTTNKLKS